MYVHIILLECLSLPALVCRQKWSYSLRIGMEIRLDCAEIFPFDICWVPGSSDNNKKSSHRSRRGGVVFAAIGTVSLAF